MVQADPPHPSPTLLVSPAAVHSIKFRRPFVWGLVDSYRTGLHSSDQGWLQDSPLAESRPFVPMLC